MTDDTDLRQQFKTTIDRHLQMARVLATARTAAATIAGLFEYNYPEHEAILARLNDAVTQIECAAEGISEIYQKEMEIPFEEAEAMRNGLSNLYFQPALYTIEPDTFRYDGNSNGVRSYMAQDHSRMIATFYMLMRAADEGPQIANYRPICLVQKADQAITFLNNGSIPETKDDTILTHFKGDLHPQPVDDPASPAPETTSP